MRSRHSTLQVILALAMVITALGTASGQNCPISFRRVAPRDSTAVISGQQAKHPPYLKIIFHNQSNGTISKVQFQVRFGGALGEFTTSHPVPPGSGDSSAWPDGAFIKPYGDAVAVEVQVARIQFADGTSWIDDGSHLCSNKMIAQAEVQPVAAVSEEVTPAPKALSPIVATKPEVVRNEPAPAPATAPIQQLTPSADSLASVPAFAVAPQNPVRSLLVPASGNSADSSEAVAEATADHPQVVPVTTASAPAAAQRKGVVSYPPPVAAPAPAAAPESDETRCPVIAEYVDLGDSGRLYARISNRSGKPVKDLVLTILAGDHRQIVKDGRTILANMSIDGTWVTDPHVAKTDDARLVVEGFTYQGGSTWTDSGRRSCVVSSVQGRIPVPVALSTQTPQVITGVSNLGEVQIIDSPGAVAGGYSHQQDQVGPGRATTNASLEEEATPEATRRLMPLVSERKASIVTVVSTPAGANVALDGRLLGQSPLVFVMVKKDQPRSLTLSMLGYVPMEYTLAPNGSYLPIEAKMFRDQAQK